MRQLDWHMMLFVSVSLVHDYWVIWGFPHVYYYDVKREHLK